MKKSFIKISVLASLFGAMVLTSCSNNDDNPGPGTEPEVESELEGSVSENMTLNATVDYELTGILSVESGATLTIPAGTKITSNRGTDHYIVVQKGGKIAVNGTANNPVIMTSVNGEPGDWGGLLLCGNAVTTAGANATAEVGGLIYGGSDNADNSGSIDYLVIEGAGAQINTESQYNGLTLYAVGSGTQISNVAIIDGADDGVEFFGGSVSVENLYLENNEDDAIDWTEGWDGGVKNAYILHTIEGFSTAFEGDNVNNWPTFENITAVSETGGTALQFKKQSGGVITGLSLQGYDVSIDLPNAADPLNPTETELANIQIEGENANPESNYNVPATVDISLFDWVSGKDTVEGNILQGTVEGDVTLDASVAYELNSSYIVQPGASLTIPAGTKITARNGGTDVYIAVLKGGTINIEGTEENPVVMASEGGNPGDWGGLTICGEATTTAGVDVTAEVGGFIYGGTDDEDSSGVVKNLVIIGTGAQINAESQYNGVSFYSVGSGTVVENIAVINGADDGVEFFGGTVSVENLYLENNEDDAVDWTEGWSGTVTNVYVSHTIAGFSTAVEADGENKDPKLINFTAISTVGGTALQFKKESGASFTNIYLEGYDTNVDLPNRTEPTAVNVDDVEMTTVDDDVFNGTILDISAWTWISATL
ncbi:hypothetical protein [Robertkochia solimangrovi]|uniref:hypothetical protein n=1 Tax=Robertkochia solimangrovi TaxID=2213046 RepID=UPI00117CB5A3|nr:hypothetical protein [Robertkochia solimangrovi]TRZ43315.1 hypothetical protein DMZ48_11580 [Robertkochia solimangrovi]